MTIKLGENAYYSDKYDASLIEVIPRADARLDLTTAKNGCRGVDVWTAYELSWLSERGVPKVAIAEFHFDANSVNIVESKSFKYYLNSYNQSVFSDLAAVVDCLHRDLSKAVVGDVQIHTYQLREGSPAFEKPLGQCVDEIDCDITVYEPNANLLTTAGGVSADNHRMYSHLLKSNCPVTGQPDWATVWIQYSGQEIDASSFLKYIVSFRQYQGFHESCVERIFDDVMAAFTLSSLCVYARYTRRGGLDINPLRATPDIDIHTIPFFRICRQ